eukprot:NODE_1375_length_551_cov_36.904382_g1299_i0.p1 GENE.NODE_1375_length_551_cov_36.904382_g1299_i0~~NODE_1375_length_551_cov_36.904382_g1299_i0.p1  ORF type:complete len:99 (-),score=21.10 NODE_1375_length_551_cov_36.904382_g1299_i0:13-309(-)
MLFFFFFLFAFLPVPPSIPSFPNLAAHGWRTSSSTGAEHLLMPAPPSPLISLSRLLICMSLSRSLYVCLSRSSPSLSPSFVERKGKLNYEMRDCKSQT